MKANHMNSNAGLSRTWAARTTRALALALMAAGAQGCSTTPDLTAKDQDVNCHRIGARFRHSCAPTIANPRVPVTGSDRIAAQG
jgi:hypothetical protein